MKIGNRLNFPEVSDVDIAFGGYDKKWFKKTRAIEYKQEDIEYEEIAIKLLLNGGTIPINTNLPKEYVSLGLRVLKAILGSFEPKNEDKEKVCGLILKSLCKE